jgi:hypothetical protein
MFLCQEQQAWEQHPILGVLMMMNTAEAAERNPIQPPTMQHLHLRGACHLQRALQTVWPECWLLLMVTRVTPGAACALSLRRAA